MKIFIVIVFGRSFSLNVNGADTISTIKRMIQDKNRCLLPHEYVLIYNGAVLADEKTLSDYKIVEESIVQLKLQCNKTQQETIEEINRDLNQIKQLQEATISEIKKITDDFTKTSSALKNRVENCNGIIEMLRAEETEIDHTGLNNAQGNHAQDYFKLRVAEPDSDEVHFRVKYGTSMAKLKKSYAERMGYNVHRLRFVFNGRRIEDEDTPKTLEMEDDDVIEVYQERFG